MPEVRRHAPTWAAARSWQSQIDKLQAGEKFLLEQSLKELFEALLVCTDPRKDQALQRWFPKTWHPPPPQKNFGEWTEYRLGDDDNRGRVIICFLRAEKTIYLVARTPTHDLPLVRELIDSFSLPKAGRAEQSR